MRRCDDATVQRAGTPHCPLEETKGPTHRRDRPLARCGLDGASPSGVAQPRGCASSTSAKVAAVSRFARERLEVGGGEAELHVAAVDDLQRLARIGRDRGLERGETAL